MVGQSSLPCWAWNLKEILWENF